MYVGISRINLYIQDSHSLKEKRNVIRSICNRIRNKYNISIKEVGDKELWQDAEIGYCLVSHNAYQAKTQLANINEFIENLKLCEIKNIESEILCADDIFAGWFSEN